jgi:hypothetical protein
MDAGLPIRPVGGIAVTGDNRPPAGATPASVATELPATKAVGGAAESSAAQNPPANNSGADATTQTVTIDPQSREVIYRVIDARTRQVIQQVPSEALLRNRAYSQAIANGTPPYLAEVQADLET